MWSRHQFHAIPLHRNLSIRCPTFNGKPKQRLFYITGRGYKTVANASAKRRKEFVPSAGQQAIVHTCRTHNVIVSARPGTGKTATAEAIVAAYPNERHTILLYNKGLQIDTAARLDKYSNARSSTFHGMAGQLFDTVVPNDAVLRALREKGDVPVWNGKPYQRVILDELQDCTDDIFWLICSFISAITNAAHEKAPRIVVLGDERQAIYGFRGADPRYLSLAPSIMTTLSPHTWAHHTLSESFRMTYENSAFVNNVFLGGEKYIVGSRRGPRPIYLHAKVFESESIAIYLLPFIQKYGAEETAFLAPSVRHNPPLQQLINHLSERHGILVAEPQSDDSPLDDDVLRGKVCVSSYHQFKGKERKLVIVDGIDDKYFETQARDLPGTLCPNTTFVALTRAREQLIVLQSNKNKPMPFLDMVELENTANIVELGDLGGLSMPAKPGRSPDPNLILPTSVAVSDLSRHIPSEILDKICTKHLRIDRIAEPLPESQHIKAPTIVLTNPDPQKRHYEDVSDINGLAAVAHYEVTSFGSLSTLQMCPAPFTKLSNKITRAVWLCREACKYAAKASGYKPRLIQMKDHDLKWFASGLAKATRRLKTQLPEDAKLDFEVSLEKKDFSMDNISRDQPRKTKLHGRADIIQYYNPSTNKSKRRHAKRVIEHINSNSISIWEIKYVAQLSLEHVIQVCSYAYIWCTQHQRQSPPKILLFNVRDGEKWEIVPRGGVDSLRKVVEEALTAKYSTAKTLTTEEFLKKCAETAAEVEKNCGKS
ncbi:unnamed protein product [Periconia digitata]|uniref:DNA helicase n=1 Tax=Periconia digitata TaxID=1303443 RepID=A0A9W4XPK8_9PLEO|nr:unnamed protein product [Periconia digitata]